MSTDMDAPRQLSAGMRTAMATLSLAMLVGSCFELLAGDYLHGAAVAALATVLGLLALDSQSRRVITILSLASAVLMWAALIREFV